MQRPAPPPAAPLRVFHSHLYRPPSRLPRTPALLPSDAPSNANRVELTPYVVVRKSDASSTTSDIPEENPVDGRALTLLHI